MALYTVKDGKIVREQFFYQAGSLILTRREPDPPRAGARFSQARA
jgi:hypothetical protein